MNAQLPIIRQMHDADGDGERARILLSCPDAILLQYSQVFQAACRRAQFEDGEAFVVMRHAAMLSRREEMTGEMRPAIAAGVEAARRALVAVAFPQAAAPPPSIEIDGS